MPKLFYCFVDVVIECGMIIVCVQVLMLYWTLKLFQCTIKYEDNKCRNYNIIKEVGLVKVIKDNRGSKSCYL